MCTVVEGSQEECVDTANGESHICLLVEANGLPGQYANCDHKDGKEAGVCGAHGVSVVADVGVGDQ